MPILLSLYKIGVLLRSAFGIALKPTAAINVHGAFPKNRSISGAVRATLGNAPYSDSVLLRSAFGIALPAFHRFTKS